MNQAHGTPRTHPFTGLLELPPHSSHLPQQLYVHNSPTLTHQLKCYWLHICLQEWVTNAHWLIILQASVHDFTYN